MMGRKQKRQNTHIFSTHGFKHLLQLNSQLLDVVDQDAGLSTERQHVCLGQSESIPHPSCPKRKLSQHGQD